MKKLLAAVVVTLSLEACTKKDCVGEFLSCTRMCDAFSYKQVSLGTSNGQVSGMVQDEKKAKECKEECRSVHNRCSK